MGVGTETGRRLGTAALATAAVLVIGASSAAAWLRLPDGTGGTTTINGWGRVTGGQISGQNLNDAMAGQATFRPGLIPVLFAALAVPGVLALLLARRGRHRVTGAPFLGCGLVVLAWGIWRLVVPDSAGILEAGEGSAGLGQWLAVAGGTVLIVAGAALMAGWCDPERDRGEGRTRVPSDQPGRGGPAAPVHGRR